MASTPKLSRLLSTLLAIVAAITANAQALEPRAYTWVPVKVTSLTTGANLSFGDVVTDANLPVKDANATVGTLQLGVARSFSFFGLTAQAYGSLPLTKAKATGELNGVRRSQERTGTSDMNFRLSVLLRGAPATALKDFGKRKSGRTIIGTSLTIQAPTGQYFRDKLINLGTGRWAFKPELAVSQPIQKRWLLDFYAATWFFTNNRFYYTGSALRKQNPVANFQLHTSYNIRPNMWAAANATYYAGGVSTIDGLSKDDRVSNFRFGFTLALPTGKRSALRLAYSNGAVVVAGTDFRSFTLGWSYSWF